MARGFASLKGGYTILPGQPLMLHLDATATAASVTDLAALLPAAGYALPTGSSLVGGLIFAALQVEGSWDRPVTTGTVSVKNTRVSNFDLADRLAAVDALNVHDVGRNVDLTSWSAGFRVSADGAAVESIRASVPGFGEIAGSGNIGNNCTLDFRLTGTQSTGSPVPFTVRGPCADPVFRP